MRLPFSSPRPRVPRSTAAGATTPQQRATLDGLEVRDSSWDEWVACEQAEAQQRKADLLEAGEGPLRRLMKQ
jgi:hypothetical protein